MTAKSIKLSPGDRAVLAELATAGEAIRHGGHYAIGTNEHLAGEETMRRFERRRLVIIHTVGLSTFATITQRGRESAS